MPPIGRKFATVVELKKLEQRVRIIEDNLGIQTTQGRAADATIISRSDDSDKEEEEREKKFIHLYVEPDLFADNINSFHKNSVPKYPDLSYAGYKTFIFICIHLHNQVVSQPKKHNTASTSEFGEYNLIFEYVFSYFTIFIYTLGKKNFSMKETDGKYMFYNTDNINETICFDYRSKENQSTESKADITFVINHKKVNNYDCEKFINLINIADRNVGVYVKKEYKDFHFQLTPSKSLNLPLINVGNQEYRPKLNILIEDKICVKSTNSQRKLRKN